MARKVRRPLTPAERRRKRLLWTVGVLGGLLLLAIVIALVVYVRARGEPPLPPDARAGMGQDSGFTAGSGEYARIQEAIRQGRRQRIAVQLTNADINQMIREITSGGAQFQFIEAYLGRGRVIAKGMANLNRRSWTVQVALRLTATDGRLEAKVDELWIGSMHAPQRAKDKLQEQMSRELAKRTPSKTGIYVETITVEPGRANVTGYTLGR